MQNLSSIVDRKFINSVSLADLEIETDCGWKPISAIHKTIPYVVWRIKTQNNLILEAADTHIVFDELMQEVFVKDLIPMVSKIQTIFGISLVTEINVSSREENMYDITVNSEQHRYFSNGILSHNTSMIQALSYALYGSPINNIRKDNLINRTNQKNMLVTVEFSVNGIEYKIERGRKPNLLRFYVNNVKQEDEDNAQGENKATQAAIEHILNMSQEMFSHVIALNTYSEPFLALKSNDQRVIIEQLLGITLLSEKAEAIKELIRQSKDEINQEEIKIKAIEEANKRVKEQIDSVIRRQTIWKNKHDNDLNDLIDEYNKLTLIDIDKELLEHKKLAIWNEKKKVFDTYQATLTRHTNWKQKHDADIKSLKKSMNRLSHVDFTIELEAHKTLIEYNNQVTLKTAYDHKIDSLRKEISKESKTYKKLETEVASLQNHKCYACGQDFHDDQHTVVLGKKAEQLETVKSTLDDLKFQLDELVKFPVSISVSKPTTIYKTELDALRDYTEMESLKKQLDAKTDEVNPYDEQLSECTVTSFNEAKPITHYESERDAIAHQSKLGTLEIQIQNKVDESDPYEEQVIEMKKNALQDIKFDNINKLTKMLEHQRFLLDLLTNKDSFIRKKIIDQSLKFLNIRLAYYLDNMGLPHQVVFKNDLQVEITELGRELDFFNLSRGEMNRVILSLSWAFRDVWENLYCPINTMFIDELLDSGMDTSGIESSIHMLKDMTRRRKKSIWVVSHREELSSRVNKVLKVVKEGGFTTYDTEVAN